MRTIGFLLAAVLAASAASAQTPAPVVLKDPTQRLLQLLQPAFDNIAQQLARQPAVQVQQAASVALQRVPAERREAVAREIEADLRKFFEDVAPGVRARTAGLAQSTVGPLLEERFTQDEVRQLVAQLESPLSRKFQQVLPDLQRALADKLVADARGDLEARARTLNQTVAKRLGLDGPAGAASAPPR